MNPCHSGIVAALFCLAAGTASAQQTFLATAVGPRYDVVAQCLVDQMEPRLVAAPVVRPPPTNRAEVHLYVHGTERTGMPVATFFVSELAGGSVTISFEERPDRRGQYTGAANAAAARCTR